MQNNDVVLSLTRKDLRRLLLVAVVILAWVLVPQLYAQKVQEDYSDKFNVATEEGGVAIAASADGKYVYIVGKRGLIMSEDHGKTGTWVQTLKLK